MTPSQTSGSAVADRALSRAMFLYGFAMFMLVYMVQPLMPRFVEEFSIAPATASQALSAATMGMAFCLIPASFYVRRIPPRPLLIGGLLGCALLSLAVLFTRNFHEFVGLRFLFGMVLSALPATALAFLSQSVDASRLGRSVGMYIAGNAMGGMSGRLLALALSEWMDWRGAFALLGVLALLVVAHVGRVLFTLHTEKNRTVAGVQRYPEVLAAQGVQERVQEAAATNPSAVGTDGLYRRLRALLSDSALLALFALAFLFSGSIVSVYNYISFRLSAAPYSYDYKALSGIYALYVLGMLGSARAGRMADRLGKATVLIWLPLVMALGVVMTLASHQGMIIVGMGLLTFGFFGAHSVASGWVSGRALQDRALASSLYLTAYYLGASVVGTVAGAVWVTGRWPAVVALNGAIIAMALSLCVWLAKQKPQAASSVPEL